MTVTQSTGKKSTSGKQARSNRERRKAARQQRTLGLALAAGGLLVLLAIFLVAIRPSETSQAALKPLRIGQPASNFSLTDLSGKAVKLSDYAGHPVLINAWATWCPPCRAEMPLLHEFYQQHQDEGFVILAVNAGEDSAPVQRFISQNGYTFPVLLDANSDTLMRLGVNSFPTSIFIGRDGVVKHIHLGLFTANSLENEIGPLLAAQD